MNFFIGTAEMVKFEWMITPWSDCSQSCVNHTGSSTIGYKVRESLKILVRRPTNLFFSYDMPIVWSD